VRKTEGRRPFGKSKSRQVDNIKMDLEEIRGEGKDWI
jgi:hypothetical protein